MKIDYDDCECPCCQPYDQRPCMMMFAALLLLFAVLACIKIHDRSNIWIKAHAAHVR